MRPGTNFTCIHCNSPQVIEGRVTWSATQHTHTCTECGKTVYITLRTCNHVLKREELLEGDGKVWGVTCKECGVTIADRNLRGAGYAFVPSLLEKP